MLPMLTVTGAKGLLYLNGRLCGETGAQAMPLSPDGVQYLEFRPFGTSGNGAVLKLRIADGRLVEGVSGDAYAVQWPNGWIAMEMREQRALELPSMPPKLLASLEMSGGSYLLVDEGSALSFGRNAQEAVFLPVSAAQDGWLRPLPYPGLCAAEGRSLSSRYVAILRADGAPEVLRFVTGSTVQLDAQGILSTIEPAEDVVGHATACTFAPDAQGNYHEARRERIFESGSPRWPDSPFRTARAWLEATQLGLSDEAAGYLLNPSEQPRLAQEVGSFQAVTQLPENGQSGIRLGVLEMAGENLALVREIAFSIVSAQGAQGNFKIERVSMPEGSAPCD